MIEVLRKYVIIGSGMPYGSFDTEREAEEYARALKDLRGLDCRVVLRDLL